MLSGFCLVFAVNEGTEKLELVRESGWVNQYVVNGVLGEESDKHMLRSKVVSTIKYGMRFLEFISLSRKCLLLFCN